MTVAGFIANYRRSLPGFALNPASLPTMLWDDSQLRVHNNDKCRLPRFVFLASSETMTDCMTALP